MSKKKLKQAARLKIPQQMPDLTTKLLVMLMADRADRRGKFSVPVDENDAFNAQLANEINAVMARLRGDHFVRVGVDNERVNRVVEALKESGDA